MTSMIELYVKTQRKIQLLFHDFIRIALYIRVLLKNPEVANRGVLQCIYPAATRKLKLDMMPGG